MKLTKSLTRSIKDSLKIPENRLEDVNGKANVVPYAGNVMPNRIIMMSAALDQYVEVIGGELPLCNTLYWNDIMRSTDNRYAKDGMEVISVIPKIIKGERTCVTVYILKDKDDIVHLYTNKGFEKTNEDYGYKVESHIKKEGQILKDNETVVRPHSFDDHGMYKPGVNMNAMFMTAKEVTEDAFLLSESAIKRMSNYKVFDYQGDFDLNNTVLKNLYGGPNCYKPFPMVGEFIEDNDENPYENTEGVLMCYSDLAKNGYFVRSNTNLQKISPDDEMKIYPNKSLVVDITVRQALGEKCHSSYLEELIEDNREFELSVYNKLNELTDQGYKLSPDTKDEFLKYKYIYEEGFSYRRGKHENVPKQKVLIDIKIIKVNVPFVGQKIIGQHGNKGVCSVVITDKETTLDMDNFRGIYKDNAFKTSDGESIDIIMATPGVTNRGNTGQLNVRTLNQMSSKFTKHITNNVPNKTDACQLLLWFTSIFSKEQSKAYEKLIADHGAKKILDHIVEHGIEWQLEPYSHGITLETYLIAIDFFEELNIQFGDGDDLGRDTIYIKGKPRFEAEVGKMFVHLLKQDAQKNMSIRTKGAYNQQGQLTKTTGKKDRIEKYSSTPIKQSTDDMFLMMGILDKETVHELFSVTDSAIVESLNAHLNVLGVDIDDLD